MRDGQAADKALQAMSHGSGHRRPAVHEALEEDGMSHTHPPPAKLHQGDRRPAQPASPRTPSTNPREASFPKRAAHSTAHVRQRSHAASHAGHPWSRMGGCFPTARGDPGPPTKRGCSAPVAHVFPLELVSRLEVRPSCPPTPISSTSSLSLAATNLLPASEDSLCRVARRCPPGPPVVSHTGGVSFSPVAQR